MRNRELVVDSFAGGGGASLGISLALGRGPDIAVNHDAAAIAVHQANHPETRHFTEDVWKVDPRKVTGGKPVGLLWASPDCKHFSRAKGSKPVEKTIRSLAWVVVRWALLAAPRVIVLENVREFEEWGPVVPAWRCPACRWRGTEGQVVLLRNRKRPRCPRCDGSRVAITEDLIPCPDRKGVTFRRFVGRLKGLGYKVQWKTLNAADYGAPTHRRRLFLVARNDGLPIDWPEPTHSHPKKVAEGSLFGDLKPWRTAAECIDWSLACPSIFDRKRPLAEATMRRIALGVKRYVLDNPRPFVVSLAHGAGGTFGDSRSFPADEPLRTVHAGGGNHAVVTPVIVGVGGRSGQSPATRGDAPLGTVTAKGDRAVVAPLLARIGQTGGNGKYANAIDEPATTLTSKAEHLLVAPTLIQAGYGERPGQAPRVLDLHAPLGTCVNGQKHALVAAFIAKHFGGAVGAPATAPLPTTLTRGTQNQLITANLIHLNHGDKQWSGLDEPMRTVTTGNHAFLVYSFLTKYFGTAVGVEIDMPLPTATRKDRFGLVTVTTGGETFVIVDIGMRMLTPRELARCQGFPDGYQLPGDPLPGSKSSAVAMIGNSVSPCVARAVVSANYPVPAEVPAP